MLLGNSPTLFCRVGSHTTCGRGTFLWSLQLLMLSICVTQAALKSVVPLLSGFLYPVSVVYQMEDLAARASPALKEGSLMEEDEVSL